MFGQSRQERGEFTERKVIAAFRDEKTVPSWIIACEKASQELDSKGVDFIVRTDVGKLNLQVKSSRVGKESHQEKYGNKPIAVVVIDINDSSTTVINKCIAVLAVMRKQILQQRGE